MRHSLDFVFERLGGERRTSSFASARDLSVVGAAQRVAAAVADNAWLLGRMAGCTRANHTAIAPSIKCWLFCGSFPFRSFVEYVLGTTV